MAKLISMIGTLSGKLGGVVYSRNRWGPYIRQLVMPTQPRTAYQQDQRARIASCAERWRDLNANDRLQWEAYATLITRTGPLGTLLSYNGFTAFVLVNTERLFVGQSITDSAPVYWEGLQPEGITFNVTGTAMTLTALLASGGSLVDLGPNYLIAWSAPWQQEGAMYCKSWRAFSIQAPDTAFPITLTSDYAARFGSIAAADDRRYFLGATLIGIVDSPPGDRSFYVSTRVVSTVLSAAS